MKDDNLIEQLQDQSTWRLLGLGIVTGGIYWAHYIKKQTARLNARLAGEAVISAGFIHAILVLSYLSVALAIPYVLTGDGQAVNLVSNLADLASSGLLIVWGFKARNRVNTLSAFRKGDDGWFHGLWTLLLTPLYFNYKVNQLNAGGAQQAALANP